MFCPNCGKSIPEDVNFCPFCGEDIESYLKLKENLQDKEGKDVSKKEERKTIQIEDIFNTKKPSESIESSEKLEKSFEMEYRNELQDLKEKEENIDETIFRLDPVEETRIDEEKKEEAEDLYEEKPRKKESALSRFFSSYKNNKFLNKVQKIGKKSYKGMVSAQEKLYKLTARPVNKVLQDDKILLGVIVVFAVFLLIPLFLYEKSMSGQGGFFASYIVIVLLAAFDGFSSFITLTAGQYFMQSRLKERPMKDEIFKYSLILSMIMAVIRFVIYLIGNYLVIIDSILLARPLGAHPILFIILAIAGVFGLLSFHWNRYEKKDYPAVLGLAAGGAFIAAVVMFLVGSTIFRMLIMGLAPHIIS